MNEQFYPTDWRTLAADIKAACNYRCQACGRGCRRPGEMWLGWEYEAVVAHLTQDYEAEAVTVACLCCACHLRHDAELSWVARRRVERWRQHEAGQLSFALR